MRKGGVQLPGWEAETVLAAALSPGGLKAVIPEYMSACMWTCVLAVYSLFHFTPCTDSAG